MARQSAGILLYRWSAGRPQVLLVHPGGPFWAKKDAGSWSIPKGEYDADEQPRVCAMREFEEELGLPLPCTVEELAELGSITQKSGKTVIAWAGEGDLDTSRVHSNTFTIEWPPKSGVEREFPEVDRAEWFDLDDAKSKLIAGQAQLVDRLADQLSGR